MGTATKILIVEDQFVEANHLRLMLKKAGHIITGMARTVEDAKNLIAKDRPELVLLDIFLSGKGTGIDLAKFLKEDNIPFIYLSANSNEEVLNKAKATQPYGFLVKPFREKDLLVTMEIAKYHEQHGLESSVRKEQLFQKQLRTLAAENGNWEERLLKVALALQPLISFDLMIAIYSTDTDSSNKILGYMRTGFYEYQQIGMEEFQNISGLKEHEIKVLQQNTVIDTSIIAYSGAVFKKLCEKPSMKKMIAENLGMQSNLTLPVPLSINDKGSFFFSFFSRQAEGYNESHIGLCERLQQPLIYTVENILIKDKKAFSDRAIAQGIAVDNNREEQSGFEGIIGKSPVLLLLFDHIMQVAPADTTVLITGESGTGKERIASSIHTLSPRNKQPFIKINCSALPPGLIESELFGHEKGAFTGATDRRVGKFEQANNGTLFLDEVGEMPLEMQVKLLRALQEKEIERVGGNSPIKVNVRIIAATNRNLEKEVAEGRFRLDLYYRLNVFPIKLPPLRERKEDIPSLTKYFIKHYNKETAKNITHISDTALKSLLAYNWPGNIRELENLIERSIVLSKTNIIEDIPLPALKEMGELQQDTWYHKTIEENEREHIITVLTKCNGRIRGIGGAADILGVPPTTLASKMQKLGIKRSLF